MSAATYHPFRVLGHLGGSPVCAISERCRDTYVWTLRDVRHPGFDHVEVVVDGHVKHQTTVPVAQAPGTVVRLMRLLGRGAWRRA